MTAPLSAATAGSTWSLQAENVSKTFAGQMALKGVDLSVAPGEVHALVGENGSGKSTFIKILTGYHRPDDGAVVTIAGERLAFGSADGSYRAGIRVVHQDLGLVDSSSVLDNLSFNGGFRTRFGTISAREEAARARSDLELLGLSIDPRRLVRTLSPALRTGVAVARALRTDEQAPVRLLILDEPTATLPEDEVERLLEIVRTVASRGVGVIYVTHRFDEIFRIAQTVTVLRDGVNVASRPINGLDRRSLVSLLVGAELDETAAESAELNPAESAAAVRVRGLTIGRVRSFDLDVQPGEIVGIAGITGSGREALLAGIFGSAQRTAGTVTVDGVTVRADRPDHAVRAGVAYLPPDRKTQGAVMDLTVRENFSLADLKPIWRWPVIRRAAERQEAQSWLDRLSVRPHDALKRPLSTLSGGNQQKVLMAKWLRCSPRLLLLDEPTQGVDVPAKAILHHEIVEAARGGACVMVSSADTDELVALCHRVVVLANGRVVAELEGDAKTVAAISHHALA